MRYQITYEKDGKKTTVIVSNIKDCKKAMKMIKDLGATGYLTKRGIGRNRFRYTRGGINHVVYAAGINGRCEFEWFYTNVSRLAVIKLLKACGITEYYADNYFSKDAHVHDGCTREQGDRFDKWHDEMWKRNILYEKKGPLTLDEILADLVNTT